MIEHGVARARRQFFNEAKLLSISGSIEPPVIGDSEPPIVGSY